MTKYFLLSLFLSFSILMSAQSGKEKGQGSGPTDKGKSQVDGTFYKSDDATQLQKVSGTNLGVWYDPEKWSVSNSQYIISFTHKGSYYAETSLYIYSTPKTDEQNVQDEIEIWQDLFTEFNLITNEQRKVNNTEVNFLELEGFFSTIYETTIGYYKSIGEDGTMTFRCVIASDKYDELKSDIIELMNGLVVLE